MVRRSVLVTLGAAALVAAGCSGGKSGPAAPPCDQVCLDGVALRSVRITMKLVYNLTLQGGPVGDQDATTPCPDGGTAHVFGMAQANAVQGATMVNLTYEFSGCAYHDQDTTPEKNFNLTLDGTVTEVGTLAVQPSSNTALILGSTDLSAKGTIYDPAQDYAASKCALHATQDGNSVTAKLCTRDASFSF